MKSKRPDRDFYHHPRYRLAAEDHGDSRNVRVTRTVPVAAEPPSYHRDGINSLLEHHPSQKSFSNETKNGRRLQDRENTNKLRSDNHSSASGLVPRPADANTKPLITAPPQFNSSRSVTSNKQYSSKPRQESFAPNDDVQNSRSLRNTTVNSTPENSTEKHGGLILLPKDVDIFQQNTQSSRNPRREPVRSDSSKPVVVVRPSFSNPYIHPKTTSTRLDSQGVDESKCTSQCKQRSDNDMSSHNFANDTSSESSATAVLPVPWTDAAKAAFYQFFKTQTKFNPSSPLQTERQSSIHHVGNQPNCLSPGSTVVQPPK
ncbi:unnamed protein product [Schistosoma turkestanicum]|nr:unnamed protein product [Schistosoma turkestanicum]